MNLGGSWNDMTLFSTINAAIKEHGLVDKVAKVGEKISEQANGLNGVAGISGFRTSGSSLWVNTDSAETT